MLSVRHAGEKRNKVSAAKRRARSAACVEAVDRVVEDDDESKVAGRGSRWPTGSQRSM